MPIMRVGQFVDYREEGISPKVSSFLMSLHLLMFAQ